MLLTLRVHFKAVRRLIKLSTNDSVYSQSFSRWSLDRLVNQSVSLSVCLSVCIFDGKTSYTFHYYSYIKCATAKRKFRGVLMKRLKLKTIHLAKTAWFYQIGMRFLECSSGRNRLGVNAAEFAFNKLLICLADWYLLLLLLLFYATNFLHFNRIYRSADLLRQLKY